MMFALMFAVAISKAQIPNGGFESWSNRGAYSNPSKWDNFNEMTSPMSVFTCERGINSINASNYLKLTCKLIPGFGIIPALAVNGKFDLNTMQPSSGFAFNQRPQSITGNSVHNNAGGFVEVLLTKWDKTSNSRIEIGRAYYEFKGIQKEWAPFNAPLNYVSSESPDSCIIVFSASDNTPANNDYLYIDDVEFKSVTSISNISKINEVQASPNPARDIISLDLPSVLDSKIAYQIYDIHGKEIQSTTLFDPKKSSFIDIFDLPKGYYFLKGSTVNDVFITKFIKQ